MRNFFSPPYWPICFSLPSLFIVPFSFLSLFFFFFLPSHSPQLTAIAIWSISKCQNKTRTTPADRGWAKTWTLAVEASDDQKHTGGRVCGAGNPWFLYQFSSNLTIESSRFWS